MGLQCFPNFKYAFLPFIFIDRNITFERAIPQIRVDEDLLSNIQMFLRNSSSVDRSNDAYAKEKIYIHDEQYLNYMVGKNCVFCSHHREVVSDLMTHDGHAREDHGLILFPRVLSARTRIFGG